MVKNKINKKYVCSKCGQDMTYFFNDFSDKSQEGYSCDLCGKEIIISEKYKNTKMITKTIKQSRQRAIDTSMPVMDWTIPKLENRFYYVCDIPKGRKYYNPVLNILKTEINIDNPVKQSELLTALTQHKLGRQIANEIKIVNDED